MVVAVVVVVAVAVASLCGDGSGEVVETKDLKISMARYL